MVKSKPTDDLKGFMIFYDEFRYIMQTRSLEEKGILFDSLYNWFETGKEPEPFSDPWLACDYYRLRDCIEVPCKKYRQRKNQLSVNVDPVDEIQDLSDADNSGQE